MKLHDSIRTLVSAVVAVAAATTAAAGIAERAVRVHVGTVDVIVYPMDVKDVVTFVGTLPAGDVAAVRDGDNLVVPTLTGMLLDQGTLAEDKFTLARKLDSVGAQMGFKVDPQTLGIGGRALKKDLPEIIRILAAELRTPAFSPEEFEKARVQLLGSIRQTQDNTSYRAQEAFMRDVFPQGHPNYSSSLDELVPAVEHVTLDEVKAFHSKYYGGAHLRLIFVGDVDAKVIQTAVTRAFAGWSGGGDVIRGRNAEPAHALREQKVPIPQKSSISVLLGQPTGLRYQDADELALRVGTAILGSGFSGRLMSSVRDREGLTYGINASLANDTYVDGSWMISATFAPALLDKGIASARRELEKWWQSGVTDAELAARKTNMIGAYQVGMVTTRGMAAAIQNTVERGLPLSWLDDYPKAVAALTREQVNDAIRKYLDPQQMVLVEAGTFETKP